jgi:hypothetical protein
MGGIVLAFKYHLLTVLYKEGLLHASGDPRKFRPKNQQDNFF